VEIEWFSVRQELLHFLIIQMRLHYKVQRWGPLYCLAAGLLALIQQALRPTTSTLVRLVPLSSGECRDDFHISSFYCVSIMQSSRFKFIKIKTFALEAQKLRFQIIHVALIVKLGLRGPPLQ
jgi:hypothetical protein